MAAGKLDRIVQFHRAALVDNGFEQVPTFADHGDPTWAAKTDASDSERWRAGQVGTSLTTRFVVRWSPFTAAILPTDQIECEGVTFDIVGIKEAEGRRQWLEITAAAKSN